MFEVNGETIDGFEPLLRAMVKCVTGFQADALKKAAIENWGEKDAIFYMGYLLGFMTQEARVEKSKLFGIIHPIFGAKEPTVEEAIRIAIACAKLYSPDMLEVLEHSAGLAKHEIVRVDAEWNF
jgi:hypothetical protein